MNKQISHFLSGRFFYYFFSTALFLYFCIPFLIRYLNELIFGPTEIMIDDAYMFVRYAKNLLAGYGASWNIDEGPVYGMTSQLHFLFIVFLKAYTSLDDERTVLLSSAIPGLLLFIYLPLVCVRHGQLFPDRSLLWRYFFWLATAGSAFIYFSKLEFHSKMGMETCLSALLHLCLIDTVLSFSRRPSFRTKIFIFLFSFLLFLTRIDNIIVAFIFPATYLSFVANKRRDAFHIAILLGVAILLTELFYQWYFGDFMPLSFYSKRADYFHGFFEVAKHHVMFSLARFLFGVWPFLCATMFFYKRKNLLSLAIFIIPSVVTISYYGTMLTIMNLEARYCFPFTVYFIVAGCIYISSENFQRKLLVNIFIAIFSAILYWGIYTMDEHRWEVANYFVKQEPSCEIADMLDLDPGVEPLPNLKIFFLLRKLSEMFDELPSGVRIVMSEYGYMSAEHPQIHIIDVIGLHDRYVARHGFSAQWLFDQKPDAIWIPHADYTCIDHDILFSKEFREEYEYYPGPWNYALRKDSPYYASMKQAFVKTWQGMYPDLVLEKYRKHYPL